ncbi:MAG: T9SS type A sorting domain-containing protein, partial [candidate division KSB1 bacterium]|nr:T9SS type A sorting domain-containing protein [candidate division KSB1 bacterium]
SVPLELQNRTIESVLKNDYGEYNIKYWRLFRWHPADSSYQEYPQLSTGFAPGNSFWLITREGKAFDVENGWSMDSSHPYAYTLLPGWNQIGNPFAFPVAVDSIGNKELLQRPVYYNGKEYDYEVTVLYPWEGYFVYNTNSTPVTISIPPVEVEAGLEKLMAIDPANEYLLQVSAEMPGTRLIDTQNYLGLLKNATEGRDELDFSEAPPIGDYLWVSIVENEERFAGNFKPLQGNGQQWELEIGATLPQRPVQMTLTETGRLPENFRLYILDKDYHCILPAKNKTINFYLDQEFPVRHLKVIVGTEEYAEGQADGIPLVPLEYHLAQNYPNPFSATGKSTIGGTGGTTIEYQLGKRSPVMLEIYNILGHRVRTLADEVQNTGHHSVRWNGLNDAAVPVTSGVYFYRLKAGEFTTTRKLVVIQ